MKYVKVPAAVQLINPLDKKPMKRAKEGGGTEDMLPITLHEWVGDNILTSPEIGKGGDGIRRVMRLEKAFDGVAVGEYVAVESNDHEVVTNILKGLSWQNPKIAAQFFPFIEAIEEAKEEKPALKNGKAEETAPAVASA